MITEWATDVVLPMLLAKKALDEEEKRVMAHYAEGTATRLWTTDAEACVGLWRCRPNVLVLDPAQQMHAVCLPVRCDPIRDIAARRETWRISATGAVRQDLGYIRILPPVRGVLHAAAPLVALHNRSWGACCER